MSLYSGVCDFRDCLSINFNDDFNEFMRKTSGKIDIFSGKAAESREVTIKKPCDLIPYYPYEVYVAGYGKDNAYIALCEKSYLEKTRQRYDEINFKFKSGIQPFKYTYLEHLENNLSLLYNIESAKPVEEQKIV